MLLSKGGEFLEKEGEIGKRPLFDDQPVERRGDQSSVATLTIEICLEEHPENGAR